ncbi:chemotaxis protein CheX [Aeromonas simiae]|uniref:Chemotaxis protein CheX n=1 Tax=Aeromonas simiae TaxID=218936 RepID=A0A5J6WRE2_9GAMM|nr:chemotaxis protein CheX [Aeromonas simiae]MDO2949198.1 chemotaxis protein CheX [Aeromonas simiae]MDO2951180.1 chemotaxis protein CheX [Aeromonas simiae]MDO2956416.1 chemotaxis protein CheX [Aeromonas simiae]QFI53686.1 chemotaxis protein CheX [Aeromonas simiae]
MKADFINPFLLSLLNVMSTMAQLELKPGKPKRKTDELARGDISGLIGMVGPKTRGSLSISLEKRLALEIMRRMLGEAPAHLNGEVTDMIGEITNMVAGGAKRMLGEKGYEFDMATPIVVAGPSHAITHKAEGMKIMMPFESEFGGATVEICFE